MRRREFIAGLAILAAWPRGAPAQQPDLVRKLGVLSGSAEDDPNNRTWFAAFDAALHSLGWNQGQNIRIERRYAPGDINQMRTYAKELVALQPDLLFVTNTPSALALLRETQTIPILFTNITDPIGSGLVSNLAKPGANATGFTNFELLMGGKWLQILKDIAPDIKRVAIVFHPELAPYAEGYVRSFQTAGQSFVIEAIPAPVRDLSQLDDVLIGQSREHGGSAVVVPDAFTVPNREQIIASVARHRLPTIYPYPVFARDGGLVAYGPDISDLYRRAASYADRILRGTKPGELSVQQPTKFELILNLKALKALGLTVPPTLLALADEVIE